MELKDKRTERSPPPADGARSNKKAKPSGDPAHPRTRAGTRRDTSSNVEMPGSPLTPIRNQSPTPDEDTSSSSTTTDDTHPSAQPGSDSTSVPPPSSTVLGTPAPGNTPSAKIPLAPEPSVLKDTFTNTPTPQAPLPPSTTPTTTSVPTTTQATSPVTVSAHPSDATSSATLSSPEPRTPPSTERTVPLPVTPAARPRSPEWVMSPTKQTYEDNVVSILRQVQHMNDAATHSFSITNLPKNIGWGPASLDLDNTLCQGEDPVTLVYSGEIDHPNFVDKQGLPVKFASIRIKPHKRNDGQLTVALLEKLATAPELRNAMYISAGKKQTVRVRTAEKYKAVAFKHAYDASAGIGPSDTLTPIDASTLAYRDVVVIETTVRRWRVDKDNNVIYMQVPWERNPFRVALNLTRVLRIQIGSELDEDDM